MENRPMSPVSGVVLSIDSKALGIAGGARFSSRDLSEISLRERGLPTSPSARERIEGASVGRFEECIAAMAHRFEMGNRDMKGR
jgi:hypothetical protein